jgi:hypothetical protein
VLDEPVKYEDDAPDATRYGAAKLIINRNTPRRRSAAASIL